MGFFTYIKNAKDNITPPFNSNTSIGRNPQIPLNGW